MSKIIEEEIIILVAMTIVLLGLVYAGSMLVNSGNSYYAELETLSDTTRWAGLNIVNNANSLSESTNPFTSFALNSAVIAKVEFPGNNLKDGLHYYAAMLPNQFNTNNILNVSPTDLDSEQLFKSSEFPIFYSGNYDDTADTPKQTFTNGTASIKIAGINYTAFHIILKNNVNYYLLKYNNSGTITPLFLSQFDDLSCFNNTGCVAEFMLPLNSGTSNQYNFYVVSQYPQYTYDVWIDGVQTTSFSQTAQAYNLTIKVKNLYNNQSVPNARVVIGEENGQNIFIPYRLDGYISRAYSVGYTNSQGLETFIVAPTEYPSLSSENYTFFIGVLLNDIISSKEYLTITNTNSIIQQSKHLQPSVLEDNVKTNVNAMNQINYFLYLWASQYQNAIVYDVSYDVATDNLTYEIYLNPSYKIHTNNLTLKTGAPNVLNVSVYNSGSIQNNYEVDIKEEDGYLIVNPYTQNTTLNGKDRNHYQRIPSSQQFIITPTSYGVRATNITLRIISPSGTVIKTVNPGIENTLTEPSDSIVYPCFFKDDLLKTIVNSMSQIIYSLYYSLNN